MEAPLYRSHSPFYRRHKFNSWTRAATQKGSAPLKSSERIHSGTLQMLVDTGCIERSRGDVYEVAKLTCTIICDVTMLYLIYQSELRVIASLRPMVITLTSRVYLMALADLVEGI